MKRINLIFMLTGLIFMILLIFPFKENTGKEIVVIDEETFLSEIILAKKSVTVTFYNPTVAQCGKDPLTTADGSKIDMTKLQTGKLRWCAVSRDLLQVYEYGDEIWIESENPNIRGYWIVKDTMASFKKNCVDLLLPENHNMGFGKERTYIKNQLPRYLVNELGWEEHKEVDPQMIENTLSDSDGATDEMIEERNGH